MTLQALSNHFSHGLFLLMLAGIPLYAQLRHVDIFDSFIVGAKEGFNVTLKIVPHLVAMLVAIGMLRASGFFEIIAELSKPLLIKLGMPPEVLPLALIRPFSGSAANGMLADLANTYGGNSYIAKLAATIMGSTETTFYVIAVYFGAAQIRRTRYAIPVGLFADLVGLLAAVWICNKLFL